MLTEGAILVNYMAIRRLEIVDIALGIMKRSQHKLILTVAVVLAMAAEALADDNTVAKPALGALSTATSAELPAKAANLVVQANAKNLKQTTMDVVKAAVGLNPAAAPAIVGSIAQTSPAMAPTASATAVALVPDQVLAIARAAAAAAPAQAGAIVEAICRVLPADYKEVAVAVADVVPGAGKEILAGVSAAIPQLKAAIDQTLASYQGSIPSVSTALSQVAQAQTPEQTIALAHAVGTAPSGPAGTTPLSLPQGPAPGAPFVEITGTPTVITPGLGGQIPPGGNRYSAP
jgi:hypothetical protein